MSEKTFSYVLAATKMEAVRTLQLNLTRFTWSECELGALMGRNRSSALYNEFLAGPTVHIN
jgi:hypothetical protein